VVQVLATVQAGRVVASDLRFARSGLDARSRRALQQSVEAALAGYDCPGNHRFEQEFNFRLE
jgi:periplasmic protein TonB